MKVIALIVLIAFTSGCATVDAPRRSGVDASTCATDVPAVTDAYQIASTASDAMSTAANVLNAAGSVFWPLLVPALAIQVLFGVPYEVITRRCADEPTQTKEVTHD